MFNANREIIQWYIDICHKNSIDDNIPYMDDLFLDLIYSIKSDILKGEFKLVNLSIQYKNILINDG